MLYCEKCRIAIRGNRKYCPLCGGILTGTPEEDTFPVIRRPALTGKKVIRISTFVLFIVLIGMGATGYLAEHEAHHPLPWAPLVMIGAVVVWLDILLTMRVRNNIIKLLTGEIYFAIIVDYIVDRNTGMHGWSVNWMIPLALVGLGIATVAIARSAKLKIGDYAVYLLIDTVLCLLQFIFIMLHQNSFLWPAVISMAFYLILLSACIIFRRRDLKNAAEKYFHV